MKLLALLFVPQWVFAACLAVSGWAPRVPDIAAVRIPDRSALYRIELEREVAAEFGIGGGPVAMFAGQIHAESTWRPDARSPYAQGLTQFTPATANWLPNVCPRVGAPDTWDPSWSMRALICYDMWLGARSTDMADLCEQRAATLSKYNGGEVHFRRERQLVATSGGDPSRWFGQVEHQRTRATWAWKENRGYVRRILLVLEPAYFAAGWPGGISCPS